MKAKWGARQIRAEVANQGDASQQTTATRKAGVGLG